MVHDEARGDTLLFGGWDGSILGDFWIWRGGRDARPGAVLSVEVSAAVGQGVVMERVETTWRAGASAGSPEQPKDGAALLSWDGERWRERGQHTAPVEAPEELRWSTTSRDDIGALFSTGGSTLHLATRALSANGRDRARFRVDYVETRLLCRLGSR